MGHDNAVRRLVHILCTLIAAHLLLMLLVHKLVVDDWVSCRDYLLGTSDVLQVASALARLIPLLLSIVMIIFPRDRVLGRALAIAIATMGCLIKTRL